jgi:ABC-type antimicrobial peptide transport system permease subunit
MTDLRFAFRQLLKSPGFTAVAVLALALGIGANTAIFTVLNSVLLRPLPYPESQQLVTLFDSSPTRNIAESKMSPAKFAELRAAQKSFAAMGGYFFENLNLPSGDHAESIQVAKVYGAFFRTSGRQPWLGRAFQKSDDDFGAEPVAVLSYSLWRDHFGSDPQVIGRRIELSREPHTIVGVMPPGFDFPDATTLWASAGFDQSLFNNPGSRMARLLTPIARLAPGASLAQAQAEAATIAARIGQRNPRSDGAWTVQLVSLYAQTVGHARLGLLVLAGAVGLVLLIACFNVANLQLARAETRQHEIAVRTALGDPSQPVFDFKTMDERLDDSVAQRRFNMILLGSFAAVALLLAAIGVYGVISFSVAQRRREIGIRLALGAQRSDVLRLVLRQGLMITAVGLGIGILLSLGAGRLLSHLLFQVNAHNPFIFICTGAILSAIALLASWLPARRAARVDPLIALRSH